MHTGAKCYFGLNMLQCIGYQVAGLGKEVVGGTLSSNTYTDELTLASSGEPERRNDPSR